MIKTKTNGSHMRLLEEVDVTLAIISSCRVLEAEIDKQGTDNA